MATPAELQAKADELRSQLAAAQADADAAAAGEPEPQSADEAHDQLLAAIVSHLGNHPKLEGKLAKLRSFQKPQS